VDAIFATADREEAEAIIEHYSRYWMDIVGTRGFKGKKTVNANSQFNELFDIVDTSAECVVQSNDGVFSEDEIQKLNQLEQGIIQ
jgi:hypothetical protein